MTDFSKFGSLFAMTMHFSNEETCRDAIVETRWGVGEEQDVVCPYCGGHHCKERRDGRFRCIRCKRNFSCKVGTIFEDSNLPLTKWFIAMYLISSHKKGISSYQLARDISVTQKTAWYVLHKVRSLYAQDDCDTLSGEVKCDEVYIGGKEKWKHKSMRTPKTQGRSTKTKTPVFGMMERSEFVNAKGEVEPMSYVHAMVVDKTDSATLTGLIGQFVAEGSTVFTDELNSYIGLISYILPLFSKMEFCAKNRENIAPLRSPPLFFLYISSMAEGRSYSFYISFQKLFVKSMMTVKISKLPSSLSKGKNPCGREIEDYLTAYR